MLWINVLAFLPLADEFALGYVMLVNDFPGL